MTKSRSKFQNGHNNIQRIQHENFLKPHEPQSSASSTLLRCLPYPSLTTITLQLGPLIEGLPAISRPLRCFYLLLRGPKLLGFFLLLGLNDFQWDVLINHVEDQLLCNLLHDAGAVKGADDEGEFGGELDQEGIEFLNLSVLRCFESGYQCI